MELHAQTGARHAADRQLIGSASICKGLGHGPHSNDRANLPPDHWSRLRPHTRSKNHTRTAAAPTTSSAPDVEATPQQEAQTPAFALQEDAAELQERLNSGKLASTSTAVDLDGPLETNLASPLAAYEFRAVVILNQHPVRKAVCPFTLNLAKAGSDNSPS